MKERVFESIGARSFDVACGSANYLRVTTQKRVTLYKQHKNTKNLINNYET